MLSMAQSDETTSRPEREQSAPRRETTERDTTQKHDMTDIPKPAIIQADLTILLEVDNPLYTEARDALASFAELVKSPEHMHTYRTTRNGQQWRVSAIAQLVLLGQAGLLIQAFDDLREGLFLNDHHRLG